MRPADALLVCALALGRAGDAPAAPPNAEPHRDLLVMEASSSATLFRTTEPAAVSLCVTNVNAFADDQLPVVAGDRFVFRLPESCGGLSGPCEITVESMGRLRADDIECDVLPDAVVIAMVGEPAPLAFEDRICARVRHEAATATSCALEFRQIPRSSQLPPFLPDGVHRLSNVAQPSFVTWDIVDPRSGPTGPTGPVGDRGPMGATGATGARGATGPVGARGPDGPRGAEGPVGARGATGPVGAVGSSGAEGGQGSPGPAGASGVAGPAGALGAMGDAGPTGPSGATGARGPSGASGSGNGGDCRKLFYLSRTRHASVDAPSACEAGFHFAAMPELMNWNQFRYDTGRGQQSPDSGYGAPASTPPRDIYAGWMRTGAARAAGNNCDGWRSTDPRDRGLSANLIQVSTFRLVDLTGLRWDSTLAFCDDLWPVWCVED